MTEMRRRVPRKKERRKAINDEGIEKEKQEYLLIMGVY